MWKYSQKIRQSKCPEWSISCPWSLQTRSPSFHTHTHLLSCLTQLLQFLIFPPSAVRQPREQHTCWGNDISESHSVKAVFCKSNLLTFKLILRANEFSIACLHSAEPLKGRTDWKDNDQGLSLPHNSFKAQAETWKSHGGTAQKPAVPAYSNICSYSHLINC